MTFFDHLLQIKNPYPQEYGFFYQIQLMLYLRKAAQNFARRRAASRIIDSLHAYDSLMQPSAPKPLPGITASISSANNRLQNSSDFNPKLEMSQNK